ncbi:DUF6599 family protein [Singulisphaera sp. Ch08]|uniref:DUF6599 family protein n=1 Tax=Singulisphaera sp. Ch08 TaxID=3120278 RepID=A0AAU7CQX5_9BACT
MNSTATAARLRDYFLSDPLMATAVAAALFALATTPLAFAILGRLSWFKARRGRVMQRPEFSSIVCAMLLVMGIPAIFMALVVKSQHFDEDRYEFDPNKTWSVLEQGRGYNNLKEADAAVKREATRLAEVRKNLVDSVKKLDESMLALRAVAGTSPAVAQAIPSVLQRLAKIHESIGLDGPQQLMDFTAPPVAIAAVPASAPTSPSAPVAALTPAPVVPAIVTGLTQAQVEAELAAVPEPQRPLAAMLPLSDLPAEWTVGKLGDKHLESFNADNLFEKIDGRAESFLQYDVKGMAYANLHPTGDESNELQVYIFEMSDSLKALGKYGSEKPDDVKPLAIGSEGYTAAGSTLFYSGRYYTQIVSTTDDPKFSAFAVELAKRIAEKQKPDASAPSPSGDPSKSKSTPDSLFALLPSGSGRATPKYAAQDVFGYSFLSDVFMADYEESGVTWQGFLRPYRDAKEALAVFEKYVESAKRDEAEIKTIEAEGADRMVVSSNIGLVDVLFLKGNVIGGANGATDAKPAETFARAFVKSLPQTVPAIESGP